MRNSRLQVLLTLTFFSLMVTCPASGQTSFPATEGIPTGAVQLPVPLGFVNALNGNLHLEIPIASVPQRNNDPLIAKFVYDNNNFHFSSGAHQGGSGWRLLFGTPHSGSASYDSSTTSCPVNSGYPLGSITTYFNFRFYDFDGTVHADTNQNDYTQHRVCTSTTGTPDPNTGYPSSLSNIGPTDQSGYTFAVSNYNQMQVWSLDGTIVIDQVNNGYVPRDTNGNYIYSTDTLGRTPITVDGSAYTCFSTTAYSAHINVRVSDGSTQTYTVNCSIFPISGYDSYFQQYRTANVCLLSSLALPDGTQYMLNYDTGNTGTHLGNLLSVTLPAGGQLYLTYTATATAVSAVASAIFGGGTWNFSYVITGSGASYPTTTATLLSPLRYDSASNSNVNDKTVLTSFPGQPYLQTAQYYSGSSTLLKTISIQGYPYPGVVTTILNDTSQQSSFSYQYGVGPLVTQKQETDFSGTVVRTTKTTYGPFNRPTSVNVYAGSGSGSPIASTLYTYDEYSANYCKNGVPMLTSITGATGHDDANYGIGNLARGNPTTISRLISGTTYATAHNCYDTLGNVTQTVDANGNPTTHDYSENWTDTNCVPSGTLTHAFPTTITDALGHRTKKSYFTCTSLTQSLKDENDIQANRSGTTFTYDLFGRPLVANYPDSGQTTYCYSHDPSLPCYTTTLPPFSTTSRLMQGSTSFTTKTSLDGYGRVAEAAITSDPDCPSGDKTDTTYDNFGRVLTVSNTYCTASDPTYGLTTYSYDALGRTIQVAFQDGSVATTSYSGNTTTVTDQAGTSRKSVTDGLGRLTQVFEDPGSSPHLNYETDYGYDALDNLLCVGQKGTNTGTFSGCASIPASWRPRTFVYDSLSRLTSATNPESGTISYAYDASGNVLTKTSPAPNQTGSATVTVSYCYDALNRITSKSYVGQSCPMSSPNATFTYDLSSVDNDPHFLYPIGRLVKAQQNGLGVAAITYLDYDAVGRNQHRAQCMSLYNCPPSFSYNTTPGWWIVTNTYDLAGDLTSYTDAFNHTFTQTFDSAGRPSQLTSSWVDSTHPATLVTIGSQPGAQDGYGPGGQLQNLNLPNLLTESRFYNKRLQLCRINWSLTPAPLGACSGNQPSATLQDFQYGFVDSNGHNNGNLASWNAAGQQTFTRSYQYDSLNRLTSMSSPSDPTNCTGLSWSYDAWGNRTAQTLTGGSCYQQPVTTFSPKNQLPPPYQYDAAGNMTFNNVHHYFYDAENHLVQVDGGSLGSVCSASATACYLYNTDGQRVFKYMNNGANTTSYIYGSDGQVVSYTDTTYAWNLTYFHFGGALVGEYAGTGTYFFHRDHLGSTRLGTDLNRNVTANYDYLPFGEQLTGGNETIIKFTGKERDLETGSGSGATNGLDNFGARYNSSSFGRFMSADQLGPGQHPENPQTWNLYSYVLNNPLKLVDPSGEFTCDSKTVNDQQCDNFQAGLDKAQDAADKLGEKYGWDSKQYLDAQRSIDAYGDEGVDNGVVIAQGDLSKGTTAQTDVAGSTIAKSTDNPTGQNIRVTFNQHLNLLDTATDSLAALGAHEGVHVADGSDWVSSGFSPNANPSLFQTEWDAYQVTGSILLGLGYTQMRFPVPDHPYTFFLPLSPTSSGLTNMIKAGYPRYNQDAFQRNTKVARPQP